ncbi:uncharacterized protein BX663DRAFT_74800 [Cokeromyces recurvatus]|uniref:uncharacterized protein n=1 Tax=Cokeromyces recurvatus TaxID=90255 RepID=UPI00221F152F|nr:uncharacterized protein BX663DRAFT_74800 [Cokeromyces recurvatus]KAI7902412.1 hypothetical protein BX663DRAFT_74800 [Cokeromyces recurvatus]
MVRTRTKKRAVTKPSSNKSINLKLGHFQAPEQQTPIESQFESKEWTPIQKEQIKLAKQLDEYISEFQQKLLLLNFLPSDRELVILFIMNLHPRWRRMVEHMELSCPSWLEVAALARMHCARVSAILGCEDLNSSTTIFKSPESRALRDSGYFVPDTCVSAAQKKQTINSIKHLLISEEKQQQIEKIFNDMSLNESQLEQKQQSEVKKGQSREKENSKAKEQDSNKDKWTVGSSTSSISDNPSNTLDASSVTNNDVSDTSPNSSLSSTVSKSGPSKIDIKTTKNSKKKNIITIPAPVVDLTENPRILTHVPPEHSGVNLTFLELPINGQKVKGLLAKMRWGSSAISLDCVQRLGLPMQKSDNFGINTDFGYIDSIGILILPIHHPADPQNITSKMEIQVLPSIYGGKVDLVLGADFFHFYNPTLNIISRCIQFLGKETPYIVEKIK